MRFKFLKDFSCYNVGVVEKRAKVDTRKTLVRREMNTHKVVVSSEVFCTRYVNVILNGGYHIFFDFFSLTFLF